ncbi:MAG: 2-oxoacid:acceptor oxidoreductase subunit alpha, partial [Acidobacteriaceae bacterium]|nr:2-oxoacid:acceptor oxidoreductase subunit alpha [Acidobacteriaceae bacterium]
ARALVSGPLPGADWLRIAAARRPGRSEQGEQSLYGDYQIIALCPNSPQECFDLTITAFNFSERYRVPVMFMMDECVGHMTEKVVIPPADEINVEPRKRTTKSPEEYRPFGANGDMVPEIAHAGEGYNFHVTGLTHDERGYPNMTIAVQQELVTRLQEKILRAKREIVLLDTEALHDADVVVVSYGITSRVAQRAIEMARAKGLRVGKFRMITAWPFPEEQIRELAGRVKGFVVPELNMGQMVREVQRAAGGVKTISVPHAGGGVHAPEDILAKIEEALR